MSINLILLEPEELIKSIQDGDVDHIRALKEHFLAFVQNFGRPEEYIHKDAVNTLIRLGHLSDRQILYIHACKVNRALQMLFEPNKNEFTNRYDAPPFRMNDIRGLMQYYGCDYRIKEHPNDQIQHGVINFMPVKVIDNKEG